MSEKGNKNNLGMMDAMGEGQGRNQSGRKQFVEGGEEMIELNLIMTMPSLSSTA